MVKKSRNKNKKLLNKNLVFTVAVIILLSIGVPFIFEYQKSKERAQQKYYENWLPDNCGCVERERNTCRNESFIIQGNYCVNTELKLFTNVVKSCSQYNCSGNIYTLDFKEQEWSEKK